MTAPGAEFHLVVDARGLEPPEPMVRVLESLDLLQFGERMLLLIHREPRPYCACWTATATTRAANPTPTVFRVVIWQRKPVPPSPDEP